MVKIKPNTYAFLYGKCYDSNRVRVPADEENWDIVVYLNPLGETNRIIGSLEGLFISEINLEGEYRFINPICKRDQVKEFEHRYRGKFTPFEK